MKDNYIFDYSKLRGKIREVYGNEYELARLINITGTTFSIKLNNKNYFTAKEIKKISVLLGIENEIESYFFKQKV